MKTLSKHHIEAIEKAKTELGKVNAAALAMVETPIDLIKAVLLKHKVAVFEVMCELHLQEQANEALLRQALEALEEYQQKGAPFLSCDRVANVIPPAPGGKGMSGALTVVYQDLSADEKRVIINDNRVARLRHGCAITERREIDRIASELQDTCHSQAKRIAEQDALLRQALEALELRCGTNADERKELIPALRERLGETK